MISKSCEKCNTVHICNADCPVCGFNNSQAKTEGTKHDSGEPFLEANDDTFTFCRKMENRLDYSAPCSIEYMAYNRFVVNFIEFPNADKTSVHLHRLEEKEKAESDFIKTILEHYENLKDAPKKEGTKHDAGKLPIGQMLQDFPKAINGVAEVWKYGVKKYGKSNWKKVENRKNRYTDAMIRHFLLQNTDGIDPETQLHHAKHVAWNALAILEITMEEEN